MLKSMLCAVMVRTRITSPFGGFVTRCSNHLQELKIKCYINALMQQPVIYWRLGVPVIIFYLFNLRSCADS